MTARDERRTPSLRRRLILAAVVLFFFVLIISSLFGKKGLIEIYQAKKKYRALQEEIQKLEETKSRLLREIEELETNPQAVDKEARQKLWLMKPEEKVIVKKSKEEK